MAIDASQLTDYTFAELRTAAKQAMMTAAIGGRMLSIGGRNIGRVSMEEAQNLFEWADKMIQIEAGGDKSGVALAEFGQRQ